MVDTRRSSRGNVVNASSTVLKIGRAAAAIAIRKKSTTEPSTSPYNEHAENKDWFKNDSSSVGRTNNGAHPLAQPIRPSYNNEFEHMTSNTAEGGANLHYKTAAPTKRAAPAPITQNNKRARKERVDVDDDDSGKAERSAAYTRLVKERKEVMRSKDRLREKKLQLDAEAAVLERNAQEIDAQLETMLLRAPREEMIEWLMKVSS